MSTMRDDINAALEADGGDFDETPQVIETVEMESSEPEAMHEEPTHEASDVPETTETIEEPVAQEEQSAESVNESGIEPNAPEPTSNDSIKAPIDWSPKEREDWSKIPRHLQEKVMSREKELGQILQTTANARRTHKDFSNLVSQYSGVLSGVMGNNPMETVSNLFSTVANLRVGTPIQKAQIVADLIQNFGVDISTLDSAIVGAAPPPEQQQNQQLENMLTERLAPFEQMMGQQNAYVQQQAQQRKEAANSEVAEFSKKAEFLNDVRNDMADLIEMASSRGQQMSMEEAYGKACALNPQITAILQERYKREQLTGSNNSMASKRAAASSVNGRQIGAPSNGQSGMSLHDTIAAAWDNQNNV